jgi:hypothetical protein
MRTRFVAVADAAVAHLDINIAAAHPPAALGRSWRRVGRSASLNVVDLYCVARRLEQSRLARRRPLRPSHQSHQSHQSRLSHLWCACRLWRRAVFPQVVWRRSTSSTRTIAPCSAAPVAPVAPVAPSRTSCAGGARCTRRTSRTSRTSRACRTCGALADFGGAPCFHKSFGVAQRRRFVLRCSSTRTIAPCSAAPVAPVAPVAPSRTSCAGGARCTRRTSRTSRTSRACRTCGALADFGGAPCFHKSFGVVRRRRLEQSRLARRRPSHQSHQSHQLLGGARCARRTSRTSRTSRACRTCGALADFGGAPCFHKSFGVAQRRRFVLRCSSTRTIAPCSAAPVAPVAPVAPSRTSCAGGARCTRRTSRTSRTSRACRTCGALADFGGAPCFHKSFGVVRRRRLEQSRLARRRPLRPSHQSHQSHQSRLSHLWCACRLWRRAVFPQVVRRRSTSSICIALLVD